MLSGNILFEKLHWETKKLQRKKNFKNGDI